MTVYVYMYNGHPSAEISGRISEVAASKIIALSLNYK